MQPDGSIHLHSQENNSVLHCGLHPTEAMFLTFAVKGDRVFHLLYSAIKLH